MAGQSVIYKPQRFSPCFFVFGVTSVHLKGHFTLFRGLPMDYTGNTFDPCVMKADPNKSIRKSWLEPIQISFCHKEVLHFKSVTNIIFCSYFWLGGFSNYQGTAFSYISCNTVFSSVNNRTLYIRKQVAFRMNRFLLK